MPKVFISYRRVDAGYVAPVIYEKLKAHYGAASVIFDVDTIPLGADFVDYLNDQVSQCDALLAIIGDRWLDARSEDGTRRLKDRRDFVRIEIQAALERNIPVIPVLIGQAAMPNKEELPRRLQPLTRRNAAEIRSGRDLPHHLELLVHGLDCIFKEAGEALPKRDAITNSIGMQLKRISAGEFMMGSPDSDENASDDEWPQHLVRIAQPFFMGVYAVTQEQYEKVMGKRPWNGQENVRDQSDSPATYVSWNDAVNFCRKLTEQEGVEYHLPTEAQWEYACRAASRTVYSFGGDVSKLSRYAWYDDNSWDVGEQYAHPVGRKQPNPWGLYDMHGNVWEWCEDKWGNYEGSAAEAPFGPSSERGRVLRGGSFEYGPDVCRSAIRDTWLPENRGCSIGFRVSRICD